MQIRSYMRTQPITVTPEESAAVAAHLLRRYNIGMLPVCSSDHRLRGVVTDRDIVLRCVALDADPRQTQIRDIMSTHVIAVSPETDAVSAMEIMGHEQIRRLPVCEQGKLVGMVSLGDLADQYSVEASAALSGICQDVIKR